MNRPFMLLMASLLALADCDGPQADTKSPARAKAAAAMDAGEDGKLFCALDGAAAFARVCSYDRAFVAGRLLLTIRRPDGGFHRLTVTSDGRGVVAADGADLAKVTILGAHEIEVTVGRDRMRLPATVGGAKRS